MPDPSVPSDSSRTQSTAPNPTRDSQKVAASTCGHDPTCPASTAHVLAAEQILPGFNATWQGSAGNATEALEAALMLT